MNESSSSWDLKLVKKIGALIKFVKFVFQYLVDSLLDMNICTRPSGVALNILTL